MNYKAMQINKKRQGGFTLVEIAIVLMIIGLLIGGMLRGQELITSARVRNIIDQKNAIVTAQIGFIDRFRMLPGDLTVTQAALVGNGANGIAAGGTGAPLITVRSGLFFQNLTAAGFLSCGVCTQAAAVAATAADSPVNVFGGVVRAGMATGTLAAGAGTFYDIGPAPLRMVLSTGAAIDSEILKEVDLKADDSLPQTGHLRYGNFDGNAGVGTCTATIPGVVGIFWATPAATNCEGTWLL